jgi:CRP-like cAMP-binding protein
MNNNNQSNQTIESLFENKPQIKLKRGENLIEANKTVTNIYYVKSGYVRQYSVNSEGRERSVSLYGPGSILPLVFTMHSVKNRFFYTAQSPLTVQKEEKAKVVEFIKNNPNVLDSLNADFAKGVDNLLLVMESLMYDSARQKIASFINLMASRFGKEQKDGSVVLDVPLTHEDIASFTGMIRETVSFDLKKLQNMGILGHTQKRRVVIIQNLKRLQEQI